MGRLLVITGPPGAGKSTVASDIAGRFSESVLVAGDSFFGFLASGKLDPWLPAAQSQNETVIKAAAASTGHFVEDRRGECRPSARACAYLAWLDLRQLGFYVPDTPVWQASAAGLALNPGHWFGREGAGFARMTIAAPTEVIERAITQLTAAVER